jgi:hypothetical protein
MLLAPEIDDEEVIVATGSRVLLVLTPHRNYRLIELPVAPPESPSGASSIGALGYSAYLAKVGLNSVRIIVQVHPVGKGLRADPTFRELVGIR